MKKIPYGIANYEVIKTQNYYFIDKTQFIERIESLGSKYLFFLRPRRFGKSLFLSILEHYYDIKRKEQFEELFGDTYIGNNPTELRNSFPILKFNFSGIPVHGSFDEVEESFNFTIKGDIESFFYKYESIFPDLQRIKKSVLTKKRAGDMIGEFVRKLHDIGVSYYLLIDEYDNFANNILIEHGRERYKKATHAGGFLRSFFAVIKNGTENRVIERLFITGVSPLVLSDVTSGMNMGDNISTMELFNGMVGVTEGELEELLDYYEGEGLFREGDRDLLRATMDKYADNYHFSEKLEEHLYNTDIVMYLMNKYIQDRKLPREPIDPNIRTDYGKLRFLIIENRKVNGNFNILQEVVDKETTRGKLIDSFAIEEIIDKEKFRSLLYYLGLLTIKDVYPGGMYLFTIPNLTVNTLLWEYLRKAVTEAFGLRVDVDFIANQFYEMAFNGDWKPLFEYLFEEFYKLVGTTRDFIWREEGVSMFIKTYLSISSLYVLESEYQASMGYVDIYLRKNWVISELTRYEYLIEMKHIKLEGKKKVSEAELDKVKQEAIDQIKQYASSKKIEIPSYADPSNAPELKKIVVITSSRKLELMEEIP